MSSQNIKRNNKIFTEQFNRKFYTYNDNGLKYLDKDISKLETKLAKLKTIREKLVIKIEQGKIAQNQPQQNPQTQPQNQSQPNQQPQSQQSNSVKVEPFVESKK